MGLPLPCLMLVTEPGDGLFTTVVRAVDGGVNVVQWRDKRKSIGKLSRFVSGLSDITKDRARLIANGDWEACLRAGVRSIHLPEQSLPVGVVRHRAGGRALIGKSVHSLSAAIRAEQDGADYIIVGTIYASPSHPDVPPLGLDFLRSVCEAVAIPTVAIGGVTPERVSECVDVGAAGVAVLSPLMRASDPEAAARHYRVALDEAWEKKKCS